MALRKLVVLYPKPAGPDHFREHYVANHLPLVKNMPGLLACRYSFDVRRPTEKRHISRSSKATPQTPPPWRCGAVLAARPAGGR